MDRGCHAAPIVRPQAVFELVSAAPAGSRLSAAARRELAWPVAGRSEPTIGSMTATCKLQPCSNNATELFHLSNDRPWAPLCRPHLDEVASDWRARASLHDR